MKMDEKELKLVITNYDKFRIINIENVDTLDLYNIYEMQQIFKAGNVEGFEDWAIDLSNIVHLDSSGIGTMINQAMPLAKKSKRLYLINPNSKIMHLLEMPGFDKFFRIIKDKSELV